MFFFFFSSRRRHTRLVSDWSSDVCSSDLPHRSPPPKGRWHVRCGPAPPRRARAKPHRRGPRQWGQHSPCTKVYASSQCSFTHKAAADGVCRCNRLWDVPFCRGQNSSLSMSINSMRLIGPPDQLHTVTPHTAPFQEFAVSFSPRQLAPHESFPPLVMPPSETADEVTGSNVPCAQRATHLVRRFSEESSSFPLVGGSTVFVHLVGLMNRERPPPAIMRVTASQRPMRAPGRSGSDQSVPRRPCPQDRPTPSPP